MRPSRVGDPTTKLEVGTRAAVGVQEVPLLRIVAGARSCSFTVRGAAFYECAGVANTIGRGEQTRTHNRGWDYGGSTSRA